MAAENLYWKAFGYFACGLEAVLMFTVLPIVYGVLFVVGVKIDIDLFMGFGLIVTTLATLVSTWIIVAVENESDKGLRPTILQSRIEWGWKLMIFWNLVGWTISTLISLICLVWMVWQAWLHRIDEMFGG